MGFNAENAERQRIAEQAPRLYQELDDLVHPGTATINPDTDTHMRRLMNHLTHADSHRELASVVKIVACQAWIECQDSQQTDTSSSPVLRIDDIPSNLDVE